MLIADSQYFSIRLRDHAGVNGALAVIPYPSNQHRREKRLLRVDKHFKTHGFTRRKECVQAGSGLNTGEMAIWSMKGTYVS
jgi:hypothetical protein